MPVSDFVLWFTIMAANLEFFFSFKMIDLSAKLYAQHKLPTQFSWEHPSRLLLYPKLAEFEENKLWGYNLSICNLSSTSFIIRSNLWTNVNSSSPSYLTSTHHLCVCDDELKPWKNLSAATKKWSYKSITIDVIFW